MPSPRLVVLSATILTLLSFPIACGDSANGAPSTQSEAGAAEGPADAGLAHAALESQEQIEAWMHLETREFPLLIWSAQLLSSDYHAPDRFDLERQLDAALDSLARELPEFFAVRKGKVVEIRVGASSKSFDWPRELSFRDGAAWLEPVLVFVREQLKLEGEQLHELEYAALNGYVAPLDPHTILLTPREHADLGVKTRGHFGGVGIRVYAAAPYIVVDEVLPDMPAAKAGLKPGDLIVKIDGQSTVNMPIIEARDLLRGPKGSVVKVEVQREGEGKLVIPIERGVIRIASVQTQRLPGDVAYLRISTFQEDTGAKVGEGLARLAAEKPLVGVVLDLRGNAGGLLTQATALLDHMVGSGELVIVHSAMGRESQAAEQAQTLDTKVPVVALLDEGSASAAEIVGGGIVNLGRGVVLGRTSFGKGTVQMLKPSAPYGNELGLKLTVAEYRVAGDTVIQGRGVTPDLELLPVRLQEIAGVAAVYDQERFERERERHIVAHLPSTRDDAVTVAKAVHTVRYLQKQWELAEGEPVPMRDAEIRLAREVAVGLAGMGTRKQMLAGLAKLASDMREREDQAIAMGMDETWGKPARWGGKVGQGGPAKLSMSARLVKEGNIRPGDAFAVKLSVTNDGPETTHRVHVLSDCEEDELDGIEYFFGSLASGETRTETLHLAMSAWHPARYGSLRFDAHVGEPDAEADASAELALELELRDRPRLAFSYWIVDDPKAAKKAPSRPKIDPRLEIEPFVIRGNGDGRLQAGEHALLAFEVRNLGPGVSEHSLLRVRNLSRTQALLEEGELSLGTIKPGKVASGSIGLTVAPAADPSSPIELAVIAGDAILRETVEGRVLLKLGESGPAFVRPAPMVHPMVLAPKIEVEPTPTWVEVETITISGVASHARQLKDIVLWVEGPGGALTDRKVAYLANPVVDAADPPSSSLPFEFELALSLGSNEISLIARDADGIEARSDIAVYRSR